MIEKRISSNKKRVFSESLLSLITDTQSAYARYARLKAFDHVLDLSHRLIGNMLKILLESNHSKSC